MKPLEKVLSQSFANIGYKFQQLLLVSREWYDMTRDYDGIEYLKRLNPDIQLDNFFRRIDVSIIYDDIQCRSDQIADLNKLNTEFCYGLADTIKRKLLNLDQMSVKTYSNSERPMKVEDLILLFRYYVNKLNGKTSALDHRIDTNFNKADEDKNNIHKESEIMETFDEIEGKVRNLLNKTQIDEINDVSMDTSEDNDIKAADDDCTKRRPGLGRGRHISADQMAKRREPTVVIPESTVYSSDEVMNCDENSKNESSDNNYGNDCQMKDISSNENITDNKDVHESSDDRSLGQAEINHHD